MSKRTSEEYDNDILIILDWQLSVWESGLVGWVSNAGWGKGEEKERESLSAGGRAQILSLWDIQRQRQRYLPPRRLWCTVWTTDSGCTFCANTEGWALFPIYIVVDCLGWEMEGKWKNVGTFLTSNSFKFTVVASTIDRMQVSRSGSNRSSGWSPTSFNEICLRGPRPGVKNMSTDPVTSRPPLRSNYLEHVESRSIHII